MTQKRISVVIPCYQHQAELELALQALSAQTLVDQIECVVVDDGSSPPLCLPEEPLPFPCRCIRLDKNRDAAHARNLGFDQTGGEFVLFLDADALLVPCALERFTEALDAHPEASFAYSDFVFGWKTFLGRSFDIQALRRCNYIHTTTLVRRAHAVRFDESLVKFQDWDYWLTMAEAGFSGVWIHESLFRVLTRRGRKSYWLPAFLYRLPWPLFGFTPAPIERYRLAEMVIKKKHHLD